MIDWCLMPTLAIFQLYHGVNKGVSMYDKGRFWPNLRNCLYRNNIKQNH